jgi:hypothetical protein
MCAPYGIAVVSTSSHLYSRPPSPLYTIADQHSYAAGRGLFCDRELFKNPLWAFKINTQAHSFLGNCDWGLPAKKFDSCMLQDGVGVKMLTLVPLHHQRTPKSFAKFYLL